MRELATSLQQLGAFILKTRLVREKAAPYWHRQPASTVVDEQGRANPLTALEQLRPASEPGTTLSSGVQLRRDTRSRSRRRENRSLLSGGAIE